MFQLDIDIKTQTESRLFDKSTGNDDNSQSVSSENSLLRSILDNSSEELNNICRSFTKEKRTSESDTNISLQQLQARILHKECTLEKLKLKSKHKQAKIDSLDLSNQSNEVTLRTLENEMELLWENRESRLRQWKQTLKLLKNQSEQIAVENAAKSEKLEKITM